ncbi:Secretory lipase domain containing protein [Naviculisporaceae sp. PSN 640]
MSSISTFVLTVLVSLCLADSLPARRWGIIKVPPDPTNDSWYNAPGVTNLEWYPPGYPIDWRAVETPSFLQAYISSAWQVKFRTTDSRFRPTWAVTTLYSPKTRDRNPALVSYQHFTDSADISFSPSYAMYSSKNDHFPLHFLVTFLVQKHPNWFINIPDYEGPSASFGAGIMAGHATLDSIRAVKGFSGPTPDTGLTKGMPVALWGYSGGALATEWAAEMEYNYAPELNIKAAVLVGLTPNMTSVFETLSSENSSRPKLIIASYHGHSYSTTIYIQVSYLI